MSLRLREWCFGAALALTALAGAQDLSLPLTYQNAGSPVSRVLAEWSNRTGVSFQARSATAADVVVLDIHAVPLKECMDRIALAVDATWNNEAGTWTLIRTGAQVDAEEKRRTQLRTAMISKALAAERDSAAKEAVFDDSTAIQLAEQAKQSVAMFSVSKGYGPQMELLGKKCPEGRALAKVIAQLDAGSLALLPGQMRSVFATDATPSERPLPPELVDVATQMVHEQATWSQAIEARDIQNPKRDGKYYALPMWLQNQAPFSGTPAKVLVSVTPMWGLQTMAISLSVYDKAGNQVIRSDDTLRLADDAGSRAPFEVRSDEQPIAVPPELTPLLIQNFASKELPYDLRKELIAPESSDPLALVAGPMLIEATEAEHHNLVALLADPEFNRVWNDPNNPPRPHELLNRLLNRYTCSEDGSWIQVIPTDPATVREERADRKALGQFLRLTDSVGALDIEQEAPLAAKLPEPTENSMPSNLASRLLGIRSTLKWMTLIRFYGALDPGQRAEAAAGELQAGSLNDLQKGLLELVVYADRMRIEVRPGSNGKPPRIPMLLREPTEGIPSGIPDGARILVQIAGEDAVYDVTVKGSPAGIQTAYSPLQLAEEIFGRQHPELFPSAPSDTRDPKRKRFQLGANHTYDFTFNFTTTLYMTATIRDAQVAKGEPLGYDDLPEDFKAKVALCVSELEKLHQSGGAGAVTPPR